MIIIMIIIIISSEVTNKAALDKQRWTGSATREAQGSFPGLAMNTIISNKHDNTNIRQLNTAIQQIAQTSTVNCFQVRQVVPPKRQRDRLMIIIMILSVVVLTLTLVICIVILTSYYCYSRSKNFTNIVFILHSRSNI